MSQVLPS